MKRSKMEWLEILGLLSSMWLCVVMTATILTAVLRGGSVRVTVGGPIEYGLDLAGIALCMTGLVLSLKRAIKRE